MNSAFHPEADQELNETIGYYEACQRGLGREFALEVKAASDRISLHPHAWPVYSGDLRRCLINRFPYGLLYSIESDRVLIVAIMHLSREPGYWRGRI